MTYPLEIIQRVDIDIDEEHGEHPGDGAILVNLAVLRLDLQLPFVPYPSLVIQHGEARIELEEVVWNQATSRFICQAATVWMQTRKVAEGIVDNLIEGGFRPLDPGHREDEIH